jgi:hypothetical protein
MVCDVNKNTNLKGKLGHFLNLILRLEIIVSHKINLRKDHIFGKSKKTFFELFIFPFGHKVLSKKHLQLGLEVRNESQD